jgi:triacylglycerol lipase
MKNKMKLILAAAMVSVLFTTFLISSALAAPTITTNSASNVSYTSATLSATFNVDDEDSVSVYFEIGDTETSSRSYTSSGTHTQTVTGLSRDTTYTYRAVLKYTRGWWFWRRTYTVYGERRTFTTGGSSPPPPPPPPSGRNPILFVHGWNGRASTWNTMMSQFRSDGYSSNLLYAYTFSSPGSSSSGSNARNARQIQGWVNTILSRTGASKVDLVSHSMGGLSTRYYVKVLDGRNKVDDYVSLGSPHHGTSLAYFIGGDMRPGSSLLDQLNSGDETPYGVRGDSGTHVSGNINWVTVRSTSDSIVTPSSTASLDGAYNRVVSGTSHMGLVSSTTVYSYTRSAVA